MGPNETLPLLVGQTFRVRTDNNVVRWLSQKKDIRGKLARWVLILQEFNFSIDPMKGAENKVADALSRQPAVSQGSSSQPEVVMEICSMQRYSKVDLAVWQQGDDTIRKILQQLREEKGNQSQLFSIKDGVLYKKGKDGEREFKLVLPLSYDAKLSETSTMTQTLDTLAYSKLKEKSTKTIGGQDCPLAYGLM